MNADDALTLRHKTLSFRVYLNKYNKRKKENRVVVGFSGRFFRPNRVQDKRIRVNCSVKCHVVVVRGVMPVPVECFKPLNG